VGRDVQLRVLFSAVLSYMDVISDVQVIQQYFDAGQLTAAQASLGFLGLNMGIQIIICAVQSFRNLKEMMLEILYTLICLKPVLEVMRIVKKKPYQTFSRLQENIYAKGAEVFGEAAPAAFLQMYVLLLAAHPSYFQYVSIIISIATAAFTIATMDYNIDTDPKNRVADPQFFGLVPDSSLIRTKIFAAMFLNSFFQMSAVVLGTASLAHFDAKIAAGMWCGRLAMVYAIKLARQDFAYYLPIRGLPGVLIAGLVVRPCDTFLCGIGLYLYAGHPYGVGCVQWWFGRVWPWLLLVTAIGLRILAPAELGSPALNTTAATTELLGANASASLGVNVNTTAAILNATATMASNDTLLATSFAGGYAQSALANPSSAYPSASFGRPIGTARRRRSTRSE
jgi:hypothetical protein